MNWTHIKNDIVSSLNARGLKNPSIRINALKRIEGYMQLDIDLSKCLKDTTLFKSIDKKEFKGRISQCKESGILNGAEDSVINEIYYRV